MTQIKKKASACHAGGPDSSFALGKSPDKMSTSDWLLGKFTPH